MISNITKLIAPVFLFFIYAKNVMAANLKDAFGNAKLVAHTGSYATYDDTNNLLLNSTISYLISTVLSFLGIIFVIISIYGGFLYLTARGNQEQTKKALNIITRSSIGLIITLSAYAISYFIFKFFV